MPSKSDEIDARTLSQSINIATRPVHTRLNKLIVFRLPLALPPQADDGSNYVSGLLHVAPIYIAFESLWEKIVQSSESSSESSGSEADPLELDAHSAQSKELADRGDVPDIHTLPELVADSQIPATSSHIRTILTDLSFPEMRRTQALRDDLMALTGWSSCTLAKHLNDAVEAPVLSSFLHHIRHAVETRPHVLLAYGWVLYMALFSGGRFIRASLEAAGPEFWAPPSEAHSSPPTSGSSPLSPEQRAACPLQFFRFNTPDDGEDLKQMFKQRLVDLEVLLSDKERDEIVAEAQSIFDFMMRMVMELDEVCGTSEDAGSKLLSLRSRDSVVVEKERRLMAETAKRTEQGHLSASVVGQDNPIAAKKGWLRFL
ncbi:hypothetical protein Micbo1qcDRAFT_53110 [Microdochium bolleyi]|uniref:Heme oxygenase-like protein n=1 Tax=Microdochium bolleyi TaxID=196109 RepID=A0A136J7D5_9PEZI|nr:hypothetical protein Micbo1qcDRAFT_53110 [Microdochium bolleyi]